MADHAERSLFESALDCQADLATVSETPCPVARWEDEVVVAIAYIRRPSDGVIRAGVAIGERRSSGVSFLNDADDPWEDADEELNGLRDGPPRLLPFGWLAEELGQRYVVVTWGVASPTISTVTVTGLPSPTLSRVSGTTRLFVTGTWADREQLLAIQSRGGLPLHGLSPAGAVIARRRTESA